MTPEEFWELTGESPEDMFGADAEEALTEDDRDWDTIAKEEYGDWNPTEGELAELGAREKRGA